MGNIRINNLKYSYNDKVVFRDLNFYLRKDKTLSIIGPSGSGKTTLLKLLNGEMSYEGNISISGTDVNANNFKELRKEIAVVYRSTPFINTKVKDELVYPLVNMGLSNEVIDDKLNELNSFFGIKKILNMSIERLSSKEKTLIKILSYAVMETSYLGIDDLLIDLDNRTKILLLNYLNYKNIKLILATSNMEETLYTDYIICLYDGISAIDGKTLEVLENEKILKRLGLGLPFMVDLSIQLQLYGLINKMYLNKEDMVKNLWK